MTYYEVALDFLLYSFLGWCVEVAFQAIQIHKVINRGFLNGPVCPVYGFGVLGVFSCVGAFRQTPLMGAGEVPLLALFAMGTILATVLELLGGVALDRCFHARWWDYSTDPFNFHGYICLEYSIIWGAAIVFVVKVVHPLLSRGTEAILPQRVGWWVMLVNYILLLTDFIVSVLMMLEFNRELEELERIRREMRRFSNSISLVVGRSTFLAEDMVISAKRRSSSMASFVRGNRGEEKAEEPEHDASGESVASPGVAETVEESTNRVVNLLETRAEYEQKRGQVSAALSQKKQALGEKTQAAREEALKLAYEARNLAGQTKEKAFTQLAQMQENWFTAFQRKPHLTLRRVLNAYPHFKHLLYNEALNEVRNRWMKEQIEIEKEKKKKGQRLKT